MLTPFPLSPLASGLKLSSRILAEAALSAETESLNDGDIAVFLRCKVLALRTNPGGCHPLSSSRRKKAVTAVHPLCVWPSSAIRLSSSSTAWNVLLSTSGIGAPVGASRLGLPRLFED